MKKVIVLLLSILLVGCAMEEEKMEEAEVSEVNETIEELPAHFKLSAAQGYVPETDYETPHTYVIEADSNKVYVDIRSEGFTDEERERITSMSEEELEEYFDNQPVYEEPIYDVTSLDATTKEILLEYEEETIVFTGISDTYYETEKGTRYIIEEHVSIDMYRDSFLGGDF